MKPLLLCAGMVFAAGCSIPEAPRTNDGNEIITCTGSWDSTPTAGDVPYNVVTRDGGVMHRMGANESDFGGAIATALMAGEINHTNDDTMYFPTVCSVESGKSDLDLEERRAKYKAVGYFVVSVSAPTGQQILFIAPQP
jgi:hypothetical protein